MDWEKLKEFIQLAKDEGVTQLKYEEKELTLEVCLGQSAPMAPVASAPAATRQGGPPPGAPAQTAPSDLYEITSPLVGTFYASPTPGDPPYVKVGDVISSGQTLCIVEAMKIMNEVEADGSGEIVEICAENESLVEYGQVLFRIKVPN